MIRAVLCWLRSERKSLVISAGLLVVVGLGIFGFGQTTYAGVMPCWMNPVCWATIALGKVASLLVTLIGQIVIILIYILLAVAQYNSFLDSTAVREGWKIVRDVANMGFVFVLMAIAIGTIVGNDKYMWHKNLGNLVGAAILINFSKTICGLVIDFGQVVMLTFVGAFAGAAGGGNFAAMLGIPRLLQMTAGTSVSGSVESATFTENIPVMGFLLALGFIIVAAVVIGAIVLQLVIRIITLWFLIVLSPMAFFLYTFPDGKPYFDKWLKAFTNAVLVGPVMAFFLWLSLAVVSAASDGKKNASDVQIAQEIGFRPEQLNDAPLKSTFKDGAFTNVSQNLGMTVGNSAAGTLAGVASYILGIGMLIGSLMAAQELGGHGSKYAAGAITGLGDWAAGKKGPSPMRWVRDRAKAYGDIKRDERERKAQHFGAKAAEFVGTLKALPGKAVRRVGREAFVRVPGVSQTVGTVKGWLNNSWINNTRDAATRKATNSQRAQQLRTEAAEYEQLAKDHEDAGLYQDAAEIRRDHVYNRMNEAEGLEVGSMVDGLRVAAPRIVIEAVKVAVTAALPGLALPAAGVYGWNAISALQQNGESQYLAAASAFASAQDKLIEGMKKLNNGHLMGIANGTAPGYSNDERAAAIRALIQKDYSGFVGNIQAVRQQFIQLINADPAEIAGFENDVTRERRNSTGGTLPNPYAGDGIEGWGNRA